MQPIKFRLENQLQFGFEASQQPIEFRLGKKKEKENHALDDKIMFEKETD